MKPCVTVSLVPEARGGPFVYWDDLGLACRKAKELGFAAIEVFPPAFDADMARALKEQLHLSGLALATLGTGGGWVKHKWTLTSGDPDVRKQAREFIRRAIDFAAPFGAAVIIGSMQGRAEGPVDRTQALEYLVEALTELEEVARVREVTLLYEHLNRYETNLFNRIEQVKPFLNQFGQNLKILADLFHMSIEEVSIADALRLGGERVGHVHLADSNRRPAGLGHTDFAPIFKALRDMGYAGYVSAEALPYPDSDAAASQTMRAFRQYTGA